MGLAPCRAAWGQHPAWHPGTARGQPAVLPCATAPAPRHLQSPQGTPTAHPGLSQHFGQALQDGGEAWERWRPPPCTGGEGQPVTHPRRGAPRCQRLRSGFISRPRAHVRHLSPCIKEPFHTRCDLPLHFLHVLLLPSEHPEALRHSDRPGGASLSPPEPATAPTKTCPVPGPAPPSGSGLGHRSCPGLSGLLRGCQCPGSPQKPQALGVSPRGRCPAPLRAVASGHLAATHSVPAKSSSASWSLQPCWLAPCSLCHPTPVPPQVPWQGKGSPLERCPRAMFPSAGGAEAAPMQRGREAGGHPSSPSQCPRPDPCLSFPFACRQDQEDK